MAAAALELNEFLPTDVMLKGDGSIWVAVHGNAGGTPRKLSQTEVLNLLYSAIQIVNRMVSI